MNHTSAIIILSVVAGCVFAFVWRLLSTKTTPPPAQPSSPPPDLSMLSNDQLTMLATAKLLEARGWSDPVVDEIYLRISKIRKG